MEGPNYVDVGIGTLVEAGIISYAIFCARRERWGMALAMVALGFLNLALINNMLHPAPGQ